MNVQEIRDQSEVQEQDRAVYEVPEFNLEPLRNKIEELNKRARRLKVDQILLVVSPTPARVLHGYNSKRGRLWYPEDKLPNERLGYAATPCRLPIFEVEVWGVKPRLDGWRFVAKLEPLGKGNIVKALPGETPPEWVRTVGNRCDHCSAKRVRKELFVVAKGDEVKVVGRQCLRDFLGLYDDPKNLAKWAELLASMDMFITNLGDNKEGSYGGFYPTSYGLQGFLEFVSAAIEAYGWVSRAMARQGDMEEFAGESTASVIMRILNPRAVDSETERDRKRIVPTDKDAETARLAIEWMSAQNADNNDYIHNCKLVCQAGYVNSKTSGIAASIVSSYLREVSALAECKAREAKPESNYVGEVKQRLRGLQVKCVGYWSRESDWGVSHIHRFIDECGNVYTWFGGKDIADVDQELKIDGTVKNHEEFRGSKQTVLTRVKVV